MWVVSKPRPAYCCWGAKSPPDGRCVARAPSCRIAGCGSPTALTAPVQGRADQPDCEQVNANLYTDGCSRGPYVPTVGVSIKQGLAIKALIDAGKSPSATVNVPTTFSMFQPYG